MLIRPCIRSTSNANSNYNNRLSAVHFRFIQPGLCICNLLFTSEHVYALPLPPSGRRAGILPARATLVFGPIAVSGERRSNRYTWIQGVPGPRVVPGFRVPGDWVQPGTRVDL